MKKLGITPIIDLCHFGVPHWIENFQNKELPELLADYAEAFVRRYPDHYLYTPVNEMYVTAKHSALIGIWNEQLASEKSFVTAVCNLVRANILMTARIKAVQPKAIIINSESSEFFQPCCPDEHVQSIARFENERRFIPLDLYCGHEITPETKTYLFDNGLTEEEYKWFQEHRDCDRLILGVDYYEWNEKLINSKGFITNLGELFGWYVITKQYYDRYRLPMMHTETNTFNADAAPGWLWRQWHNIQLIRKERIPVVGFTWYSLLDQVDWDIALTAPNGNVNPCGLFDLNRDPRPVAQAYKSLIQMYKSDPKLSTLPMLEEVSGGIS